MAIRDFIKRDLSQKVEGVVKVFDGSTIATEVREYVLTDKTEEDLKRIFDTFTQISESIRHGGKGRDVMGVWVSGFFGSGKSHFAKVLGYLLQNEPLPDGSGETSIDAFLKHLSDQPHARDIRLRLGEIKQTTAITAIPFEIRSRQSLNNPNSVGEILLGEFYRYLGYSENFVIARIEQRLKRRGLLKDFTTLFQDRFGISWDSGDGRDDLSKARRRLAELLPEIDPKNYPDEATAKQGLRDDFAHSKITAEGIADELVAWVDEQRPTGGKTGHLVFVIDEMGTFVGDSNEKIGELNSLAEMIGNKGKGKVWMIATSQQDLEKVVDRTNFQPALVGRLNARFELKPHLVSDGIDKVISERILKKHPANEDKLAALFRKYEGKIAQLADIKASRTLGRLTERTFLDCYPFLPHQIQLAQDIGEALSGFRISGGVRSMISVIMESVQSLADKELGAVASLDMFFDALENDLLSQEYLGAAGVRSVKEADERVPVKTPIPPSRVLKILWLIQQVSFVPRIVETLAKLLVRHLDDEIPVLRTQVEETLGALQEAGYTGRDEATGEWKFLNERERNIEQEIQTMVRPGGSKSISIAAARRTSQEIIKTNVLTRKKLQNFAIPFGKSNTPFGFGVFLDGEAVSTGPELEVHFLSPLASGRKQELEAYKRNNQQAGAKGRVIYWAARAPGNLETRFKRYEALVKVTGDKRFTDDSSKDTQDALSEKRKERDDMARSLAGEIEQAFLNGTVYVGGQVTDLDRAPGLLSAISNGLTQQIPNIYSRFSAADKTCDFGKQLNALLNPAQNKLHEIAPELDLFDSQGNLQKESALVRQTLEVIRDLENEGIDPLGAALLDSRDSKGFKGFSRAPFHWPDEIVRLILAASFRAGAVFFERHTASGPTPHYDYRGTHDDFAKINTFKKTTFRLAETTLTVEQIKEASKALISLGVGGTPESGNALASAARKLGQTLLDAAGDAQTRAESGLPIPDSLRDVDAKLREIVTQKNPTKAVSGFLAAKNDWQSIHKDLGALKNFLSHNRHHDFARYCQLLEMVQTHPIGSDHPDRDTTQKALLDITAIVGDKAVIARWSDYQAAIEKVLEIYREAYREAYDGIRKKSENLKKEIVDGNAYAQAPADQRDNVLERFFGSSGACFYPALKLGSAQSLLDAGKRHSLASLAQAHLAIPVYRTQIESALRQLIAPPPKPDEKRYTWHAANALSGRQFSSEDEVDETLNLIADDLKQRIREGYVIDVE